MLIVITEAPTPHEAPAPARRKGRHEEVRVLEERLLHAEEDLQTTREEMQSSQEELKSTNEELQSTNEELQSTNEELTTSREEMQSLNEELQTVNTELESRVADLSHVNDDMKNLLNSTRIATVFLDAPAQPAVVHGRDDDAGQPAPRRRGPARHGHRVRPLLSRPARGRPGGAAYPGPVRAGGRDPRRAAVLGPDHPLPDAREPDRRRRDRLLRRSRPSAPWSGSSDDARAYAEAIVATIREPLLVLDGAMRVVSANGSFYETFRVAPGEVEGLELFALGNGQWESPELRQLLETVIPGNTAFDDFRVDHVFPAIGRRVMLLNARRVVAEGAKRELILLAFEDVTGTAREAAP